MCECGCTFGNPVYRLPIDDTSCYTVELYAGCKYCYCAPGIVIRKVNSESIYWEEVQENPVLSLKEVDGCQESVIKCGLDPYRFRKIVINELGGMEVEDGVIDKDYAEIIGEDLWEPCVRHYPEVL